MADTSAEPIADSEFECLFSALPAHAIDTVMLAVSGGTDSLALLHLFSRYQRLCATRRRVLVTTVDHQLRAESAAEAAFVAAHSAGLGLPHETLPWTGGKPATGRQEAARDARYALMGARLAKEPGTRRALLTAHTANDQAETLLMRLARGSSLDGLAGMAPVRRLAPESDILLIRPLLETPRARLVATLKQAALIPKEDPTNADPAYERVRMRSVLMSLAPLGLTPATLTRSASRLRRAQEALDIATRDLETRIGSVTPGLCTSLDMAAVRAAPAEIRIRLLARAIARHRGIHPPAEMAQIEGLAAAVIHKEPNAPRGATLGGCAIQWQADSIVVLRELGRRGLPEIVLAPGATLTWDDRFEVTLSRPATMPVTVRALPAAIWPKVKQAYAGASLPAAVAHTLPSLWQGETLVALPAPASLCSPDPNRQIACCSPPAGSNGPLYPSDSFAAALCSLRALPRTGA